ncbi:MAG: amidohydrolase family protein [Chloroflexi bacterium]|nr:amidohydrolase family protein [Chloroflexota bacterium]
MLVDSHCHILPPSFPLRHDELTGQEPTYAALFPNAGGKMATAESLLAAMEEVGVEHAVVCGFGWVNPEVAREVNDYLIDSAKRYRGRLTGFGSVNPCWGEGAVVAEIERLAKAGLRGIGELHPDCQGFDIGDPVVMSPVMNLARSLDMSLLLHTSEPVGHEYPGKGRTTPDRLYRLALNFPDNKIIGAHWGGGLPFYGLMPEVPGELENVYFDTAASPFLYRREIFDIAARTIGAHKILLGTDYPLVGHRRLIRQVEESELSETDKKAILGGNAARLLGIGG